MRKSTYSTYSVSPSRSWLRWAGIVIIFGAFIGLLWYAASSRDELMRSEDDLELIMPSAEPVKLRATNPGGMEIDNRDKEVFNLLDSSSIESDIQREELCAGEDSAALCNKRLPKVTALAADPKQARQVEKEARMKPKGEDIALLIKSIEQVEKGSVTPVLTQDVIPEPIKPIQFVEKDNVNNLEVVKPKLELAAEKDLFTGNSWGVQLASYKNLSGADTGAKIFLTKYPEILKPLTYVTEKVDIPNKGTFYRVQFIGLKNKAEARKACDLFKDQGQGCWYVSR